MTTINLDTQRMKILKDIIFELTGSDDNITPNASLEHDLELDSLDLVELVMAIEEKFGINEIPYDEADSLTTVADVLKLMEKYQRKQ
jgi:acyl carrier protein